jgi:hypothetical protein
MIPLLTSNVKVIYKSISCHDVVESFITNSNETASCQHSNGILTAHKNANIVTLTVCKDGIFEILAELELDDLVTCITWESATYCLIITQSNGIVHFVSANGDVMVSYPLVAGKQLCMLKILFQ